MKNLGFLIAPIKAKDPRLWDVLNEIRLKLEAIEAEQARAADAIRWHEIHLELPVVTVTNDILLSRNTIVFPKDAGNNQLVRYWKLRYLLITAKTAPSTTDFICDIQQSQDRGTTFRSLFPDGMANKVTLDVDLTLKKYSFFSVDRLNEWDMLRVDGLQTDVDVDGVELILGGRLVFEGDE